MKKKGLIGVALSTILLVSGCSFGKKDTVEGNYDFDRIEVDGEPIVIRCTKEDINEDVEILNYCHSDLITGIEVNKKTIVFKDDFEDEGEIELKYELSDDGVFLIDNVSSKANPIMYYEDGEIVFAIPEQTNEEECEEGKTCFVSTLPAHKIYYKK